MKAQPCIWCPGMCSSGHFSAPTLKAHPFFCSLALNENGKILGLVLEAIELRGRLPKSLSLVSRMDVH